MAVAFHPTGTLPRRPLAHQNATMSPPARRYGQLLLDRSQHQKNASAEHTPPTTSPTNRPLVGIVVMRIGYGVRSRHHIASYVVITCCRCLVTGNVRSFITVLGLVTRPGTTQLQTPATSCRSNVTQQVGEIQWHLTVYCRRWVTHCMNEIAARGEWR